MESPATKLYRRTFIREWREYRRLSQDGLVDRLPPGTLSKASLSRIENGKQPYSQENLELIAEALGCSPVDLLSRAPVNPAGEKHLEDDPLELFENYMVLPPEMRQALIDLAHSLVKSTGKELSVRQLSDEKLPPELRRLSVSRRSR